MMENKKGQILWKKAKKIIPGGNMLLSKRPEMFLPDQWPAYFSKAKGCKVWDLDGKEYTDMSIMGIGTNTLGYGHPEVDEAVHNIVRRFKFHMLPELEGDPGTSRRFVTPDTFNIEYQWVGGGGKHNTYLNKIATCVLKNMSVKYGGGRSVSYTHLRAHET